MVEFRGIEDYINGTAYKIEAIVSKEGKLVMTSLSISSKHIDEYWDNEEFLLDLLYALREYSKSDNLSESIKREIESVIPEEDYIELLNLLEASFTKGFYDEQLLNYRKTT